LKVKNPDFQEKDRDSPLCWNSIFALNDIPLMDPARKDDSSPRGWEGSWRGGLIGMGETGVGGKFFGDDDALEPVALSSRSSATGDVARMLRCESRPSRSCTFAGEEGLTVDTPDSLSEQSPLLQ
jgi:hypothetical protein